MESNDVELNKNQDTKPHGGKREGAGRKAGSTNKLKITDFFTPDERVRTVEEAKHLAFGDEDNRPDKDMLKFLIEQVFGKAKQTLVGGDEDDTPLTFILAESIARKNNVADTKTRDDSKGHN